MARATDMAMATKGGGDEQQASDYHILFVRYSTSTTGDRDWAFCIDHFHRPRLVGFVLFVTTFLRHPHTTYTYLSIPTYLPTYYDCDERILCFTFWEERPPSSFIFNHTIGQNLFPLPKHIYHEETGHSGRGEEVQCSN